MRAAFLSVLVGCSLMVGLVGLFAWSPWDDEQRERELAWVRGLAEWRETNAGSRGAPCERRFDERVGLPPTGRLEPVARVGRRTCRGRSPWAVANTLIDAHSDSAHTVLDDDLSRIAASIADVPARVYCWREDDWTALSEHYVLLVRDEFWLAGVASPALSRIDLSHSVCDPLRRFFHTSYSPFLNLQSYELAEAIVTLAHEAEHLRTPRESEAVVECHAVQRVRALVREAGRRRAYQAEMAGLAWEVGYPQQFADYRTRDCRDGGPLDLHAGSRVWP